MIPQLLWVMLAVSMLIGGNVLHSQPLVIDDTTRIWNTTIPFKTRESARTAYAQDAGLLFTATNDGVYVLRASDGVVVDSIILRTSSRTDALDVACSRDAKVLCMIYRYWPLTNNLGGVLIMEYPSKRVVRTELDPPPPNGGGVINWASSRVSVSPSGRYIVVPWDSRFHVRILDLQRDTSWVIPGLPWRATSFDDSETMSATRDGPNSESDSNVGQCRVSWLSDPLNNFRNFDASYGADVSDSELRLSHNGRYLVYSGSGTYDMQMRRLNPGVTLWDIESGAKVYDSHYEGGGGPLWGFGPDDSWFVAWLSHPVYGNGTYVFFVGDSIPRYRFKTYTTYFSDDFSKAYDIVRNSTKVSARQITTRIVPVSVEEELGTIQYPNVRRGSESTALIIRLGTDECDLVNTNGAVWQLFNSSIKKVAEGKIEVQSGGGQLCEIETSLSVEPAPGMYILMLLQPEKGVKRSIKLMLD